MKLLAAYHDAIRLKQVNKGNFVRHAVEQVVILVAVSLVYAAISSEVVSTFSILLTNKVVCCNEVMNYNIQHLSSHDVVVMVRTMNRIVDRLHYNLKHDVDKIMVNSVEKDDDVGGLQENAVEG